MRTLWRNAHLTTLADATGWGFIRRGALVADDDVIRWVGFDADLPAGMSVVAEQQLDDQRFLRRQAWRAGKAGRHVGDLTNCKTDVEDRGQAGLKTRF